ncbi:MarR family winged helix-turn-helix transcriptional regulator [Arthrobacter crystallopoietes]|uniref:MarR family winged helix-turn-helix transcriptional regulator n=1 Tax=Crystallibacter crystallopoietes TaxID=37928 RepID=UPI0011114BBC|nr:MarR family winged helix-turn-helix transcriptional regulator [Arthrobacter crystallopoietes]
MTTRSFSVTLHRLLRRLNAEHRLSSGKRDVRYVTEHGRTTTSDLAAVVHVGPQANSLAASALQRLGYVVPVSAGADSRRVMIGLTDAGGQKLARKFSAGHEGLDRGNCGTVDAGEAEAPRGVHPHPRKLAIGASVD